jgi:hypothetical protein
MAVEALFARIVEDLAGGSRRLAEKVDLLIRCYHLNSSL